MFAPASHRNRLARGAQFAVPVCAAALSVLAAINPATAGLVIDAVPSSAPPGGGGNFDILLNDTGGTYQVTAFSIEPTVPASSGIKFTSVTPNPITEPYIFGTLQSPPFTSNSFPNVDFTAQDIDKTSPTYVTLNTGQSLGLANVTYSVVPAAETGQVPVTFGANTSLTLPTGGPITFTTSNGPITIALQVPEPASLGIVAAATLIFSAGATRRRPPASS